MTTFPELREAQRHVSEFKGDLDSDEFKNRIEVLRFRAALSTDAVLAHIDAQAAEIERLREALKKITVYMDQSAFEDWAARTRPSGDAESVSYQWEHSPEYMDLCSDFSFATASAALEQTK